MSTTREVAERIANDEVLLSSERKYLADAIDNALQAERERAAKIADSVEDQWNENARHIAQADDLVGSLAQSTYTSYAEVAGKIAKAIREGKPPE